MNSKHLAMIILSIIFSIVSGFYLTGCTTDQIDTSLRVLGAGIDTYQRDRYPVAQPVPQPVVTYPYPTYAPAGY